MKCYTFSQKEPLLMEGIAVLKSFPAVRSWQSQQWTCLLGTSGSMCKEVSVPVSSERPPVVEDWLVHRARIIQGEQHVSFLPPSLFFFEPEEETDRLLLRVNTSPSGFWKKLRGFPCLVTHGYGTTSTKKRRLARPTTCINGWWYDGLVELSPGDALYVLFFKYHDSNESIAYRRFVVAYETEEEGLTVTPADDLSPTAGRHMLNRS